MDCYFIYGNNNNNNNNNNSFNNYYMSDNYKNEMQELEKKKKKKYGKKQSCGSRAVKLSTDPQSVAARERRHRISEKFKILQSLVPGGSKLDTVSMLEEAIVYVKYLKTQLWWLIHQQQHQHQNININHLLMDEHEATSSMFNDLPPINCDHNYLNTDQNQFIISDHVHFDHEEDYCKDDDDDNVGEYDQQVHGFQDSNWFQNVEGQQQTLNVDDIDHLYYESW